MHFEELRVRGAYVITPEFRKDERGFFGRMFCEKEFAAHQLETHFVQANNSSSVSRGTLRGMHFQLPPSQEVKLVRCIQGELWDVVLDLRPTSPTFKQWDAATLTAENRKMMYVPKGCAHGFLTLTDNSEVIYLVSEFYSPTLERGVRWDDPAFKIQWPFSPTVLSDRDRTHPDYLQEAFA